MITFSVISNIQQCLEIIKVISFLSNSLTYLNEAISFPAALYTNMSGLLLVLDGKSLTLAANH